MNTKKIPFVGAATALVTPMNEDTSIDYASLRKLIEFQIKSGIDALLILGTTGESCTITDKEKREIVEFAADTVGGRVPLIVGTGTNDTRRTVEMSEFACSSGADAVLVVTPYYNKATDEGLVRHFSLIADACEKPVILYNIPSRTGVRISLPVYQRLSVHENIVAVKEASGDISATAELISTIGDSLAVYSGNDSETVPVMALGGVGVFSVLSNIMPRETEQICSLMRNGRTQDASALSRKLLPLVMMLFSEVNPIPVKEACEIMGLCLSATRPPLCGISDSNRQKLINEMKKQGLI